MIGIFRYAHAVDDRIAAMRSFVFLDTRQDLVDPFDFLFLIGDFLFKLVVFLVLVDEDLAFLDVFIRGALALVGIKTDRIENGIRLKTLVKFQEFAVPVVFEEFLEIGNIAIRLFYLQDNIAFGEISFKVFYIDLIGKDLSGLLIADAL